MTVHSRRDFLVWVTRGSLAAASALAIGQVVRYFSFEPPSDTPSIVTAGTPDAFPDSELTYVPAARVYVGRDSGGLYAVDAVCTHLGCLVEQKPEGGFACPCHGSRFAANGEVQNGPAEKPLRHLALDLDPSGQVTVDRMRPAPPNSRLAVNA